MRNDARPMGTDATNQSPLDAHEGPSPDAADPHLGEDDARESVTHDRQSHIVNRDAREAPRASNEQTMPTDDSTLRTKI